MTSKSNKSKANTCLCGHDQPYDDCCGKFILGNAVATSCEQLMRSRYSAYANKNVDYLLNTWAEESRPQTLNLDEDTKWLGLKIKDTKDGLDQHDTGEVEFVARYKIGGKAYKLSERSRFIRRNGAWLYLDGDVAE